MVVAIILMVRSYVLKSQKINSNYLSKDIASVKQVQSDCLMTCMQGTYFS